MRINRLQPGRVRVAAGMRQVLGRGWWGDASCLGLLNVVENPSGAGVLLQLPVALLLALLPEVFS